MRAVRSRLSRVGMVFSLACPLALCVPPGARAHAADAAKGGRSFSISLSPGDGTILCLGTEEDFQSVRREYFTRRKPTRPVRAPGEPYHLDYMPFGFYLSDQTDPTLWENAAAMKLGFWQWYDRLLKILKQGGANTIYVQGNGNLFAERASAEGQSYPAQTPAVGARGELVARVYARFAHARGFKVIIQPNDVYFREPGYFHEGSYYKKNFRDPEYYFNTYLKPRIERYLPLYRDNKDIFAWCPVEELSTEGEKLFTTYKKLWRSLAPNQLHYQLDSQQADLARLKAKEPPYPDLYGIDRYCWWCQPQTIEPHGENLYLWTPHFATRWLYYVIKEYADAVNKLYHAEAVFTMQGPALFCLQKNEDVARFRGWKQDPEYVAPTAPHIRWYKDLARWGSYGMYLPPGNAERLSCWLGICAGFKGNMVWAGVANSPAKVLEVLAGKQPRDTHVGIIHYDLTTTPQWQELSETWKQMKPLERLILAMRPSDKPHATSTEPQFFMNSFKDSAGRRFLIVVNGVVGKWDGYSPEWLNYPTTKLTVDMSGNLANYTPLTEPRQCTLTLNEEAQVFDLRRMSKLPVAAPE